MTTLELQARQSRRINVQGASEPSFCPCTSVIPSQRNAIGETDDPASGSESAVTYSYSFRSYGGPPA